jgi:hypothetical protein
MRHGRAKREERRTAGSERLGSSGENRVLWGGMDRISPLSLVAAALMIGAGLYVIQRGRVVLPQLFSRIPFLREHRRASGYLYLAVLTLSIVMAGFGCRMLYQYFS